MSQTIQRIEQIPSRRRRIERTLDSKPGCLVEAVIVVGDELPQLWLIGTSRRQRQVQTFVEAVQSGSQLQHIPSNTSHPVLACEVLESVQDGPHECHVRFSRRVILNTKLDSYTEAGQLLTRVSLAPAKVMERVAPGVYKPFPHDEPIPPTTADVLIRLFNECSVLNLAAGSSFSPGTHISTYRLFGRGALHCHDPT